MGLFIYIDGVERASSVRLTSGFSTASAAELGAVSVATIQVDDPSGSMDLVGMRSAYIVETAASPTRIWSGFLWTRTISRGPFRNSAGRLWTCECVDLNWNLTRRIIRSEDGKRGAETDLARMTWLLAHASLSGLVYTGTLTNLTDNPINLGEADYRGQTPMEVIADLAPVSGKTAFVLWNESNARPELFYDQSSAAVNQSSAKISNVLADVDSSTVFAPLIDATLTRSPEDTYSGIRFEYIGGGFVYRSDTATSTTFADRDFNYVTSRVGRQSTALTLADAFLVAHGDEADTLACTVELPRANVNDVMEGQAIQVKFSHLPGLSSYDYRRITRRNVAQKEGDDTTYVVTLELSDAVKAGFGSGDPGNFPPPAATAPGFVQHVYGIAHLSTTVTLPAAPTEGNLLVCWQTTRGNTTLTLDPSGWTVHPDGLVTSASGINADQGRMMWRIAGAGESATVTVRNPIDSGGVVSTSLAEFTGIGLPRDTTASHAVSTSSLPATVNAGTLTPTAGKSSLLVVGLCAGVSDFPSDVRSFFTPGAGWTELDDKMTDFDLDGSLKYHPLHWFGYQFVNPTSGSYSTAQTLGGGTLNYRGDAGESVAFLSASAANPPKQGQEVGPETVTMSGSSGTTAFPFADGSLRVYVDDTDQTAAIDTYDGATGTFTLLFIPTTTETVVVWYQGR